MKTHHRKTMISNSHMSTLNTEAMNYLNLSIKLNRRNCLGNGCLRCLPLLLYVSTAVATLDYAYSEKG